MCFLRNFSLCDAENCLQVMSSELFSWQVICWTGTMGLIIACTSWWWNILAFFGKKCVFLLCGEKRGSWTSVSGQKPWNIKNLSESLRHSWLSPICAQRRVAAGRDQGTNCWKISYKCQWWRIERWGNDWSLWSKGAKQSPTRWCNWGITQLTLWQSQKDSPFGLWLALCCLMWWSLGRWYLGNTKEKKNQQILLLAWKIRVNPIVIHFRIKWL